MKIALTDILEHNGYTLGAKKNIRRKSFRERLAEIPADVLIEAVKSSTQFNELGRKLGLARPLRHKKHSIVGPHERTLIIERCKVIGIDTSHIKQRVNKKKRVLTAVGTNKTPEEVINDFFSGNDVKEISWATRIKLIRSHNLLPNNCSECGILPKWNGLPLRLQVDHINGDRFDNRIDNLRILCPNCHSQTHTFGWKNRKLRPFEG